jgi:hypothetical protein
MSLSESDCGEHDQDAPVERFPKSETHVFACTSMRHRCGGFPNHKAALWPNLGITFPKLGLDYQGPSVLPQINISNQDKMPMAKFSVQYSADKPAGLRVYAKV